MNKFYFSFLLLLQMIPPKIDGTLTKNPLTAKTGESITVTVVVQGDPQPKVDWYVNGKIILPGTPRFTFRVKGKQHQLGVKPVTEAEAVIRVVARNWLGVDTYDQRVSFYKGSLYYVLCMYLMCILCMSI